MSNPNQLFLLADHIKLSLLERQRAQSLDLDSGSKDGHISRSLDQFKEGLAALEQAQKRLQAAGDEECVCPVACLAFCAVDYANQERQVFSLAPRRRHPGRDKPAGEFAN